MPLKKLHPKIIKSGNLEIPVCWRGIFSIKENSVLKRDLKLVLHAHSIPFFLAENAGIFQIYVPPLYEIIAKKELGEYIYEFNHTLKKKRFAVHKNAWLVFLFFIPVIFCYAMQTSAAGVPYFLPPGKLWVSCGSLDAIQIKIFHQWHRVLTSLTLHADIKHLAGNIFFGAFFLFILSRITGPGRAFMLSVLGGGLGNITSVFLHTGNYKSIGFSTAIFSSIGLLAGIMCLRSENRRKMLMAIASGAGLLALLGTDGENTDYIAHLCGFLWGILLGLFESWHYCKHECHFSQCAAAVIGCLMLAFAWYACFFYQYQH